MGQSTGKPKRDADAATLASLQYPFENNPKHSPVGGDALIFLDVDGVLNCDETFERWGEGHHTFDEPDEARCKLLQEIVRRTSTPQHPTRIVMSSTWRLELRSYRRVEKCLAAVGLEVFGFTSERIWDCRCDEISEFIDRYNDFHERAARVSSLLVHQVARPIARTFCPQCRPRANHQTASVNYVKFSRLIRTRLLFVGVDCHRRPPATAHGQGLAPSKCIQPHARGQRCEDHHGQGSHPRAGAKNNFCVALICPTYINGSHCHNLLQADEAVTKLMNQIPAEKWTAGSDKNATHTADVHIESNDADQVDTASATNQDTTTAS